MSLRKKRGLVFAADIEKAKFEVEVYNNNKYINVQGPIPSKAEIANAFNVMPEVKDEDRLLPNKERIYRLNYISYFHSTTIREVKVVEKLMSMQDEGYLNRYNDEIVDIDSDEYYYKNKFIPKSIGIFGISGCGKTTVLEKVQEIHYEGIIHLGKKGDYANPYKLQIPIVKINLPSNCTIRTVCERILTEINKVAIKLEKFKREGATNIEQTDYTNSYHFPNTESLLRHLKAAIEINAIGLLILDEVHNLKGVALEKRIRVMNFFVELSNEVKVPLVFVGKEDAIELFTTELQNGRRLCTERPIIFTPFKFNAEWELFLSKLFTLQWIRNPMPYGKEISAFLYEMSHGIPDIVVKVFKGAQEYAIETGREEINIEIFIKEYQERFALIDQHLMQMDEREVPYRITNAKKRRIKNKGVVSFTTKPEKTNKESNIKQQLIQTLIELGYDSKESENLSKNAIAHLGEEASIKKALQIILAGYKEDKKEVKNNKVVKNKKKFTGYIKVYNEMSKEDRKNSRLIYEALKEKGYIAERSEFLNL